MNATLITGLDRPTDIAVYGGNLYVVVAGDAGVSNGYVAEYSMNGTLLNPAILTGLDLPTGIAIVPEPACWACRSRRQFAA